MAKKETVNKSTAKKTTKRVAAKKVEVVESTNSILDEINNEDAYNTEIESGDTIISEVKDNTLDELIIMNEEEMVENAKESVKVNKKENNDRVSQRVDNIFGYLWNGQEMDY